MEVGLRVRQVGLSESETGGVCERYRWVRLRERQVAVCLKVRQVSVPESETGGCV